MRRRTVRRTAPPGGRSEQDESQGARLEDGQVLGECGLESGPAQSGDVEDLLDSDRPTRQADHEQAQIREQSGDAAAHRLARDATSGPSVFAEEEFLDLAQRVVDQHVPGGRIGPPQAGQ